MAFLAGKHLSTHRRYERTQEEKYALFQSVLCSVAFGITFIGDVLWVRFEKGSYDRGTDSSIFDHYAMFAPFLAYFVYCAIVRFFTLVTNSNFLPRILSTVLATMGGLFLTFWSLAYFIFTDYASVPVFIAVEICILIYTVIGYRVACSEDFSAFFLGLTIKREMFGENWKITAACTLPGYIFNQVIIIIVVGMVAVRLIKEGGVAGLITVGIIAALFIGVNLADDWFQRRRGQL